MKRILLIAQCLLSFSLIAQTTVNGSITHSSGTRTYKLYVPASYTAGTPVPLVLNLHGYGSNNTQQLAYTNFNAIADTANFLILAPQGTNDPNGTAYWNANFGGSVNDIDFINALLDSISDDYSVNQNRIYSTGMSNGGFMSLTLAGQLHTRIAAVASVTGSMSILQVPQNTVNRPMPVMQIHGDSDATVPYIGSSTFLSIDSVLNYWVAHNNCNTTPVFTALPNINTTDGCTAEKYEYLNGDNGAEVVHYKIIGGGHTWPGAVGNIGVTNRDFKASIEIWKFFNKYEKSSLVSVHEVENIDSWFQLISENPSKGLVSFSSKAIENCTINVLDINGKVILKSQNQLNVDLSNHVSGVYFIQIVGEKHSGIFRIVKM